MSRLVEILNGVSGAWGDLMLAVLWQSTLLAGLFALAAWMLRRSSPAVRYWLWQILAIKLLLMPAWTIAIPLSLWPSRSPDDRSAVAPSALSSASLSATTDRTSDGSEGVMPQPAELPIPEPSLWRRCLMTVGLHEATWTTALLVMWALGLVVQGVGIARHRRRLERVLRRARVVSDPRVCAALDKLVARLGLHTAPAVVVADVNTSPFVCGLRRPRLVLPQGLIDTLEMDHLRSVLLHELAHIKRRDLLWGWIPEIARIVYFFHPVAHWLGARVRLERELACDQITLAHGKLDPARYADTLVRVVSRASEPALLRAAAATGLGLDGNESLKAEKPPEDAP